MATEIPQYDFIWQQGADGEISLVYKINDVVVDLTGWKLRMDVRSPTGTLLFTFNSDDIVGEPGADVTGSADNEATLNADGEIYVVVPRAASLGDGPLASFLDTALPYDIFLRDATNKQRKILKGTITLEASTTRWN